jgi:hypothetical protein
MKTEDYYSDLLVGAEDWAIDQIRESFALHDKQFVELVTLKTLVRELVDMLEQEETSDSGTDFHPTRIVSCRVMHTAKLNEIMPKITAIVRGNI